MPRNPPPDPDYYPSPREFEAYVADILKNQKHPLTRFDVQHNLKLQSVEGEFQIDITASFRVLGVDFLTLIECKHMRRALERDDVQILADKLRVFNAQKGIIFCTGGFQSGAIEFARHRRIALVKVVADKLIYETKSAAIMPKPKAMMTVLTGELITPTPHKPGLLEYFELTQEIGLYLEAPPVTMLAEKQSE